MNKKEATAFLDVSEKTLERLVKRGELSARMEKGKIREVSGILGMAKPPAAIKALEHELPDKPHLHAHAGASVFWRETARNDSHLHASKWSEMRPRLIIDYPNI